MGFGSYPRLLVAIVAAAFVLTAAPGQAEACSCLPPNVQQAYHNSTDVFSARIISASQVGDKSLFRARVIASYKGCTERGDTVLLESPNNGAACGVNFSVKQVYLLTGTAAVGSFGKDVVSVHSCSYNVLWKYLTDLQKAWLAGRTVCCGDSCHCADGSQPFDCKTDPCDVTDCGVGDCLANYCGGCKAEFYSADGIQWCAPCESDSECAWSQVCSAQGECVAYCGDDADCPAEHWCSQSQDGPPTCQPFQQEGEWCGGLTPIWAQAKCGAGLVCADVSPFVPDLPGTCRVPCAQDGQCGGQQYCSGSGYCRDHGACWEGADCVDPDNVWPHIGCAGFATCGESGMCAWSCGFAGLCEDLAGVDFGECAMPLGIGVVDGTCTFISGCGANGVQLFESMDDCAEQCE